MTESIPLLLTRQELTNDDRRYLSTLQEYVEGQDSYFCCFKVNLTRNVFHFRKKTIDAYVVKIRTLGEDRWSSKKELPFRGEESFPGQPVGNIWEDYQFDLPTTTKVEIESTSWKDLRETRKRENCPRCQPQNNGQPCDQCAKTSFVVTSYQITARWLNEESTVTDIPDPSCLVPHSVVRETKHSHVRLRFDDVWSHEERSLDSVLDTCPNLPQHLHEKINRTFFQNHFQKAKPIRRLSLAVHHIPIIQCQYQLSGLPGKSFTFCILGSKNRLFVTNESLPCVSERLARGCAIC